MSEKCGGASLRSPFTGFVGRDGTMSPAMQLLQHHQALGSLRPPSPGHHMPRPQHPHPHRPPPLGPPGHMQPPHSGLGPMPRPGGMPPPPWGPPMRPPMHGEPITTVECCSQAMPFSETDVKLPAPPTTCPASSALRPVSCTIHSPARLDCKFGNAYCLCSVQAVSLTAQNRSAAFPEL